MVLGFSLPCILASGFRRNPQPNQSPPPKPMTRQAAALWRLWIAQHHQQLLLQSRPLQRSQCFLRAKSSPDQKPEPLQPQALPPRKSSRPSRRAPSSGHFPLRRTLALKPQALQPRKSARPSIRPLALQPHALQLRKSLRPSQRRPSRSSRPLRRALSGSGRSRPRVLAGAAEFKGSWLSSRRLTILSWMERRLLRSRRRMMSVTTGSRWVLGAATRRWAPLGAIGI